MKQNVSAPVAIVVIALIVVGSAIYFSRPQSGASSGEKQFVLPPGPPQIDEEHTKLLHEALDPVGIACLMPPLATDRFKGARVAMVGPGSPAESAGVKPGDLITRFGDAQVASPFDIIGAVMRVDPKKPTPVVVVRAGKQLDIAIAGLKPLKQPERVL